MSHDDGLPNELRETEDLLRRFEPLAPAPELEQAALSAAGHGDPDVALGNVLIARGLLDEERAAEAWRLLQAYKREFPAVELSHVLKKHGMVAEEPLRALWAEIEERSANLPGPGEPAASVPPASSPAPSAPLSGKLSSSGLPMVDPDAAPPIPARLPDGMVPPPGPHFEVEEPVLRPIRARSPVEGQELRPKLPAWPPEPFVDAHRGGVWREQRPVFPPAPARAGGRFEDSDPWLRGGEYVPQLPPWRQPSPIWTGPPRTSRSRWAVVGVLVGAGVSGVVGLGLHLRAESHGREREAFFRSAKSRSPEDALAHAQRLPGAVREEPEVVAAIAELEALIAKTRARSGATHVLDRLSKVHDLKERLAICEEALALDPTLGKAYVERGRVEYALRKRSALEARAGNAAELTKEALADALQAIKVEPDSAEAYLFQAQLYLAGGDRTSALTALKRVQELDPHTPLGQLAFGLQEEINRRFDQAIAHYNVAIDRDITLVLAYLARARARIQRSDYARALSDASEARRRDATSSEALALQAEARYYASNRSDRQGPLQDLGEALKLDPTNAHALALRAYVRLEREQNGELTSAEADMKLAEQDAQRALRLDAEEWLADASLAEVADARRQRSMPLTHASKAVEKSKHPDAYLLRGRLRGKDGDDDNASSDFDWVLRLTENLPGYRRTRAAALANKAAIQIKRRELTEAKQKLDKALELDSNMPEAYYNRGLARYYEYEARRQPIDLQQAIQDFSEAINRKQSLSDAYFYRAMAYIDCDRIEEAFKDLDQAEALRKEGIGYFQVRMLDFVRGLAHFNKKEYARAQECLEAYLESSSPGDKAHPKAKELIRSCEEKLKPSQPDDHPPR